MRTLWVFLVVGMGVGLAVAGDDPHEGHAAAKVQDPRFEFLAGLAGTWISETGGADMPAGMPFEFRVTAGGTAVEEREMIGTPQEMVTLYHMEGGDLVATHYCMLGNQPRMRAAKRVVDDTLSFACAGKPGNARSHDDEHVHAWSIRRGEDGRVHYTAQLAKDGEVSETHELVLVRQPETASR